MTDTKQHYTWLAFAAWVLLSTASLLMGFLLFYILMDPFGGKGNPIANSILVLIRGRPPKTSLASTATA